MANFGDFSFKVFVFDTDLFGKLYLLRSETITFKQIVTHSFVTHKGVAVGVEGFARALQVIKLALCFLAGDGSGSVVGD